MSKKFYTSDLHLFHNNIIKYCNRPCADIWEMHELIVNGLNEKVQPNDELFILGDVSFYGGEKVQKILERINGQKHFIIGNHDAKNMKNWSGWKSVNHYLEIKDEKQKVILCHYPIESWNGMAHGSIHLHGHRHGVTVRHGGSGECTWGFRADVGVDPWKFKAVSLDDLTKKWLAEGRIV